MKTVYVGMSGGVDSSVTAALLKQQGYGVVGVYMQNWTQEIAGVACPWKEDLADAKSVAAALEIPFKVFDFQTQYKSLVVDYMVAEYQAGRTPNPDIMCNQEIKFKLFLETALEDGADLIATGHYARIKDGQLYTGLDHSKDQSYFLYRVSASALEQALMPIGEFTKIQVRKMAAKLGLPTASKPDSQGICFVGQVGIKEFLQQYVQTKPGRVVGPNGEDLGEHDGAIFYTIGQRHGLGIGGGRPYYVTGKNMKRNEVYVTDQAADEALEAAEFTINDCHWITQKPDPSENYQVRTRYRAGLVDCRIEPIPDGFNVVMSRPERAVSAGQSAVLYSGDKVLGGGIISAVEKPKFASTSYKKMTIKT